MFGGDAKFKSCIQWIAASKYDRKMQYYSFNDPRFRDFMWVLAALKSHNKSLDSSGEEFNITVGEMYSWIVGYSILLSSNKSLSFFAYLKDLLSQ